MISIIIVGYNSLKDLPECLTSIHSSSYKTFRVIFVNNTPDDKSDTYLKKHFPKTIIIQNPSNIGFAAGNNLGIKKAIELKSDYILLLNPDTVIDSNCLINLFNNRQNKTILQPKVLLYQNNQKTDLINTTGSYLNFLGISYCNDYLKKSTNTSSKPIPLASGAAMFFPTQLFLDTGGFDESYFMYDEDMDLSWRARLLGYNIKLIPTAVLWHKYSFSKNKQKYYFIERNRLVFLLKNFSLKYLLLIFPAFSINEFLMLFYSLINGWFILKLKSYAYILKNWNQIFKTRTNHSLESKIKTFISSEINFPEINSVLFIPYNYFLFIYWQIIKILI
jgi:GT2 family glycosyltransferase